MDGSKSLLAFVNAVLSQKKYEGCSNNSRSALVVPAAASDTPVEYKQWMQAERIMEVPAAVPAAEYQQQQQLQQKQSQQQPQQNQQQQR